MLLNDQTNCFHSGCGQEKCVSFGCNLVLIEQKWGVVSYNIESGSFFISTSISQIPLVHCSTAYQYCMLWPPDKKKGQGTSKPSSTKWVAAVSAASNFSLHSTCPSSGRNTVTWTQHCTAFICRKTKDSNHLSSEEMVL